MPQIFAACLMMRPVVETRESLFLIYTNIQIYTYIYIRVEPINDKKEKKKITKIKPFDVPLCKLAPREFYLFCSPKKKLMTKELSNILNVDPTYVGLTKH